MKTKTICIAIATLVVLNALMVGANITNSQEYELETLRLTNTAVLSQDEEFNVSSYHDYALASMDILVSRLINMSTGKDFHASDADWQIY